jgi:glyoxylase-like metal-dependent hydrolase (beta-lactamase superfamily II)
MSAAPEVYALRYATQEPRAAADCLLNETGSDAQYPFDYFFWVIRGQPPIVVDCGFDQRTVIRAARQLLAHPGRMLQQLEIDPAEVRTVILTHLHYDHAGCLDLFPNAKFLIQRREVAHFTSPAMGFRAMNEHYRTEHIGAFMDANFQGRVVQVDGAHQVAPGISVHLVPGHTPGQQVVRIGDNSAPLVLASDALHLGVNLRRRTPFPILTDIAAGFAAFETLLGLAGHSEHRIVPGHDPTVRQRNPAYDARVPDIVRLAPEPIEDGDDAVSERGHSPSLMERAARSQHG